MAGGRVNRMSVAVACRRRTGDASASSRRVRMKDGAGAVVGDVVGATRPASRSVMGVHACHLVAAADHSPLGTE